MDSQSPKALPFHFINGGCRRQDVVVTRDRIRKPLTFAGIDLDTAGAISRHELGQDAI
jgi:hypothetical protein